MAFLLLHNYTDFIKYNLLYYLINEKQLDFCNSLENIWC